jgi:hypothetical protein
LLQRGDEFESADRRGFVLNSTDSVRFEALLVSSSYDGSLDVEGKRNQRIGFT